MRRPKAQRPAWRICANDGCTAGFKPKRVDHKFCSETCQHAARYAKRYETVAASPTGGIGSDGGIFQGSDWSRPVIEVSETPQNDPRFWL